MIDKLGAIVLRQRKMLVARSASKNVYFIPGGKRNNGETDQEALSREVEEELGAKVVRAAFYKQFNLRNFDNTQDLQVRAYITEIDREPTPTSEIAELMWVGRDDYHDKKDKLGSALHEIIPNLIRDNFL